MSKHWESGLPVNILRGIVPTAILWDGTIGYAFLDDGGVFTDDTVDANDAGAGDVDLMPAVPVLNDAFYFLEGFSTSGPFNSLKIALSTSGVGGTGVWEYYDVDTTWKSIPGIVDDTIGLTAAPGTYYVQWPIPSTVQHVAVNGQDRYAIRFRVLTAYAPIPVATQIWLGRYPTSLENITDGDMSTVSGQGTSVVAGAGAYGKLVFDLGSIKTVLVGARVGVWASAGSQYVWVQSSDDGTTYKGFESSANSMMGSLSSSEIIMDSFNAGVHTGRYLRVTFYNNAAATGNAKIYEIMAYELGV